MPSNRVALSCKPLSRSLRWGPQLLPPASSSSFNIGETSSTPGLPHEETRLAWSRPRQKQAEGGGVGSVSPPSDPRLVAPMPSCPVPHHHRQAAVRPHQLLAYGQRARISWRSVRQRASVRIHKRRENVKKRD